MDCRARDAPADGPEPTTLYGKAAQVAHRFSRSISRIGCNPTLFGIAELLGFCTLLGLVYYIDVHRGPVFEKPSTAQEREEARLRDLKIRREVAGYSDEPRHHLRPPLPKPDNDVTVNDCSECAKRCTGDPNCVSYECNPQDLKCELQLRPPQPAPSKCSGVEIDLMEGGHVKSSRRLDYYCDTDKHGKKEGWRIWGLPSRHPGLTAVFLLIVMFYAIISWFFVYARHTNAKTPRTASQNLNPKTDKPFKFSNVLGKATVTLLGIASAVALLALGIALAVTLMKLVLSWLPQGSGKGRKSRSPADRSDSIKVLLNFAIAVGGIGLIYVALRPLIDQHTRGPYIRLIKNVILYIPCLLVQFSDMIAKEWRIAPHGAWVLLGIEALFVGLRFIWPWAEGILVNHDGKQLLGDPVYLDVAHGLGTFEMLHVPKGSKEPKFKYSYGLSAWFTLNPQPPNVRPAFTRYTTILDYGNKPRVSFNMEKDALRVESESGKGKVIIAEITGLSLQTWNNIVINYDAGTMDVFLNGELIGSHPGITPFMQFEEVVAGKTRGLEGGICNVVYHPEPLSKSRITMGYRMLRDRFPPTSG